MFTLTAAATTRIRQAAAEDGLQALALRVAARRERDGSITYGMGFDEPHAGERPMLQSDGITVLIAAPSKPLLEHTELDFVEMEPGQFGFVFVRKATPATGGCGSCAGGGCGTC